jgi:hypothetical protein
MALNMQSTLETIFMEAAKVFGKSDAEKLLTKVFESETKKEHKPKAETTKRISRMTPTLSNQLKSELIKVGLTFPDDDKKEFEKLKKEFVAHIDGLTDDDFTAQGLADHMREFAGLKKPAPAPAETKEEEKPKTGKAAKKEEAPVADQKEKPKKGKAAKKEEAPAVVDQKKTLWDEMKEVKSPPPPSNAAPIDSLTLDELRSIEMLATPDGGPIGVFWDGDDGRWVRGPDHDDEDGVDKKFNGISYSIGEKTGRIYDITDGKRQVFVGFAGVGKFREFK